MLETIKLTKSFSGQTAVHKLNLKIEAGEIFALLGPNGAGKTTTINLLLGFLSPEEGEARVDGANVADDPISAVVLGSGMTLDEIPLLHEVAIS